MSSPGHHHHRRHHSRRPAKVHSPSTTGAEKRRKLMNEHPGFGAGGGSGDQFPPHHHHHHHHGAAYPPHPGYYMFVPEGGEGGGVGDGIPEGASGSGGPPPLPPPMPHGYGYAPPTHPHSHPPPPPGAGHHHPTHDPYFMSRTGSAGGGGNVPPSAEGYYLGPPLHSHYGAPPPPHPSMMHPPSRMMHSLSGESNGPNKIHQPRGHNTKYTSGGGVGDYEHGSSTSTSPQKNVLHPSPPMTSENETSPGATANDGNNNNESETTPTSVMANDDTLDTRSPEGSRNLNPLEERVQGIVENNSDEQGQQHHTQQAITRTSSSSGAPLPPTTSTPSEGEQAPPHTPSSMVRMPQYHEMHPPPLPPPGMVPYYGPPPPPPHPHHQGMHSPHMHPSHNRHPGHPYMPPTIVPQSPHHHHHHVGGVPGYPSPTHRHAPPPPTHPPTAHLPNSHHPMPGTPQFLPQFHHSMSPQHHRSALPSSSRGGGGDGNINSNMPQPPPPSSTRVVNNSNGETMWTCEYCNLKFDTWENCAAHEEADCPAASYYHQQHQHQHHPHNPRPHLHGYAPPPPGQYPPPMHGGMMHPCLDNVISSNEQIQPYGDVVGRNSRAMKGRKMTLSAFPNNAHLFVDQNAEYAMNTDRVTYLFSTPSDVDSLSDRQCYVRSHFVEIFISTASDVGSRHSRGAQMLKLGQIGLRCAYCVKLRQRDRAERAICYPSSISRIYQTVADMQRFHFESCVAIPPKVLHAYRSLKTTRPRGVGSPQSYWDQSARDIGLVDSKNGIQVSSDDDGRKFEMQRKSVVTGMLAITDGPSDASRGALIMQDMLARQEDADEEGQPQGPQAMQTSDPTGSSQLQAAVVSSPGSDTGSKADEEDVNLGVAPSTPKSAKDVEAEEDANILLMLKKTPESPPRIDSLESRGSSGSIDHATPEKNDGDETNTNPIEEVTVDGLVAQV